MQRWRVSKDAQRILNSLHCKSWFVVGDLSSRIVTALGGRRGCKFGGVIFNAVYEDALAIVRAQGMRKNMVLQLFDVVVKLPPLKFLDFFTSTGIKLLFISSMVFIIVFNKLVFLIFLPQIWSSDASYSLRLR